MLSPASRHPPCDLKLTVGLLTRTEPPNAARTMAVMTSAKGRWKPSSANCSTSRWRHVQVKNSPTILAAPIRYSGAAVAHPRVLAPAAATWGRRVSSRDAEIDLWHGLFRTDEHGEHAGAVQKTRLLSDHSYLVDASHLPRSKGQSCRRCLVQWLRDVADIQDRPRPKPVTAAA